MNCYNQNLRREN